MTEPPLILVVEDEPQMAGIIAFALETAGYRTHQVFDGEQALTRFHALAPALVVMDIMLPKVDGLTLCRQIREIATTPVILLTARKEDEDIVRGFELGADDYVTKPFNPRQLVLRVQAVLRRTQSGPRPLGLGPIQIDPVARQATFDGARLELTPVEFQLLLSLAAHAGRVLSWQSLLKEAWQTDQLGGGKEMVKTAVYRLRQKIEPDPEHPRYLHTVRGVGYTLSSPEDPQPG
ncbi:MAG TPA: response regulator transcription factor [Anaerolineales bacterium]|nr:response regulator transcription factor [Anaerolineales bacterium]HRF48371.1 response regulator transcription factor [Anaerolineales bacterium]